MTTGYVADTGVFVRCGGPDKGKFQRLRRAVRQAGVTLRLPKRVYEELGGDPAADAYPSGNIPMGSRRAGSSSPTNSTTPIQWCRR